jgi:hypothetical protein
MFDFAKIHIRHRLYRRSIRAHPLLSWHQRTHADGYAPINCTHVAHWGGWTFYGNSTQVIEVRGSFHCHYYGGKNWKPFTLAQLTATVDEFCDAFSVFAGELQLVNLEIGINVRPPIPVANLLPLALFHKTQLPSGMEGTDRGIVFYHPGRYRVKLYDKGHQYPEAGDLIRFEVHIDRKAIFHAIGIRTFDDLTRPEVWEAAKLFLLERFDEVFFHEPGTALERLRPAQRTLVEQAHDPDFWMGLPPKLRSKKRQSVERIYDKYATPKLKAQLRANIVEVSEHATLPVGGDERRALDEPTALGGTNDAMCACMPMNTRVIRHHYGMGGLWPSLPLADEDILASASVAAPVAPPTRGPPNV